ncbi:MAG: hypothetical protein HQM14_07065 [SAR324 cluster bacterium]|nr:hypothetical protein [SAR324 cluster bacterium]
MKLTIEQVEQQFIEWRQSKKNCRERIPSQLLQAAASLAGHHKIGEITRRLRLDGRVLCPYLPPSSNLLL